MNNNYSLSIIIPARNEIFLKNTIEDLLKNKRAKTEIIAVLDGEWASPPIEQHPDVNIIYVPESIGQRAATNLGVKLSKAKFVMKLDSHCSWDEGYDAKMLQAFKETGDNVTMVGTMRNLWAFSWKCYHCGWKKYQGPTPEKCEQCGRTHRMHRKMVWMGKERPQSNSFCFDSEPHFQYANDYTRRSGYENGIIVGYDLTITPGLFAPNSLEKGSPLPFSGSQPSSITSIVSLLTDFANSHPFSSSSDSFRNRENVSVNTMSLSSVDNSRSIRTPKILGVGDELKMKGITTTPILAEMVNNRDILTSPPGDITNQPSINKTVYHFVLPEIGQVSISNSIKSPLPIPTAGDVINSDIIKELNDKLGGEFVYNEKAGSFHNGSVALTPIYDKDLTETMSLQGSCWMCTRKKYWELNMCDESLGNWGNLGIEIAARTWLNGGRVLVNTKTWYAHMFRTQGGDFGFPYHQSGNDVSRTKKRVKDLFWNNKWDKAIHPLSWLIEKFFPIKGWDEKALTELKENESLRNI